MSIQRLSRLTRKMSAGTFAGQSRAAQPTDRPNPIGAQGTVKCACARVWVDSFTTTMAISGGFDDNATLIWEYLNESEGSFSIAGTEVSGPIGLYWFGLTSQCQSGAPGTDPVVAYVQAGSFQASTYLPHPFDINVPLSGWTTLPFQVVAGIQSNAASTRSVDITVSAKLWRMCDCTAT